MSGFVSLAARRAVEGQRARAEAEALARLAGSSPAATVARDARPRCSASRAPRCCTAPTTGGASRRRRRPASRRAPTRRATAIVLDVDHVLALAGPPLRTRGPARARRVRPRARSLGRARRARGGGTARRALSAANELRAALLAAVSHDLRTPLAAIKASVTSLLPATTWSGRPRRPREFLADDRRGDRPAQRARRQSARHEPAPGGRARGQRRAGRPRRGAAGRARQPRRAGRRGPSSTSRSRSRACSPTRRCSSGRSRT